MNSPADQKWYEKNGLKYHRAYREKNRELRRKWNNEWIASHKDQYNASKYIYRDKLKYQVLSHYSDGKPKCCRCGFDNIDALCLDHVNDDGAIERKKMNISCRGIMNGSRIYEEIRKRNYPSGLQVLCANCNLIKEIERKRSIRLQNPNYRERIKEVMFGGDVNFANTV